MDSNPGMHIRHLQVDLSRGFARHWNGGDAYRSMLLNALSMMFPTGEQFFIDSVKAALPRIEGQADAALLRDVKLFIGQEATHRRLHAQYNDELARQGLPNWVDGVLKRLIRLTEGFPVMSKLAATAGYEHWTAVLGDGLLRHASWTAGMEPQMRAIWRWHAAEESEHKAVAFDVYRAAGGGYLRRVGMYTLVTLEFFTYATVQSMKLLKADGQLWRAATWRSALRFWWGREGIVWHVVPHFLRYYKPGFHPWQHDNRDLLEQWREGSRNDYRLVGTTVPPASTQA